MPDDLSIPNVLGCGKHKQIGRKPLAVPLSEVTRLAAQGMTMPMIAKAMGTSLSTIQRRNYRYEAFMEAYEKGQALGISGMTQALYVNGTQKNNVVAQIFWLKNNAGWVDKVEQHVSADLNINLVSFNEPKHAEIDVSPQKQDQTATNKRIDDKSTD